ncbi:hypothetical protein [uncultured Algimonas sp.]|uniref:hypothetical protein n=1 Tax=uncultured Algimonas sp. TaxID=1547920 RepID=UPI0026100B75|nr:hypothetical protein [uncultured Algimonas sp.]
MAAPKFDLTYEHRVLDNARAARRYFAKFERIIGHMRSVTRLSVEERQIGKTEGDILGQYLSDLSNSFTALSYKYLMTNRASGSGKMSLDKTESGFPVFSELIQLATDARQAKLHLGSLPEQDRLKKDMVNHILSEQTAPIDLQYAMAQRIYYETLDGQPLFLSQNHPQAVWVGKDIKKKKRRYILHWAVYDSKTNIPVVYLMKVDDTGSRALPQDERRWPRVQDALMAQAVSELKLLTIAKGFDTDFRDLAPKSLRRFHLGPMHSHAFTEQHGPIRDVLAEADSPPGLDWSLAWTVETLLSEGQEWVKTGIFNAAWRQVYTLDAYGLDGKTDGYTRIDRALILPHRAYQVLEEKYSERFDGVRKYVVGRNDTILSYR